VGGGGVGGCGDGGEQHAGKADPATNGMSSPGKSQIYQSKWKIDVQIQHKNNSLIMQEWVIHSEQVRKKRYQIIAAPVCEPMARRLQAKYPERCVFCRSDVGFDAFHPVNPEIVSELKG
jgi:hypothetical protein